MRMWGKVCVLAVLMALPAMAQAADQRDDRAQPIPNETTTEEQVVLGCTVQEDHTVSGCKVLNQVSEAAGKEAVKRTNGHATADRSAPGDHVQVTYIYRG